MIFGRLSIFSLFYINFVLKSKDRENMKRISLFLLSALLLAVNAPAHAVVATTQGHNLTSFNSSGATNNNNWNALMNSRTTPAAADFGNCNALIMRCAQPKCANGGCTDMTVASSIVSGCVQSNVACKQYGDDLVQYISAQLVASSTAKANTAAAESAAAAQAAAAQQNAQQLQAMQAQMQQMQAEMAAQNAQTVAQLQSALEEQKQLTADAMANNSAASAPASASTGMVTSPSGQNELTAAQVAAAQSGVSAEILLREQISGQILSSIENAEVAMKDLKATMENAFEYAGCDKTGNNCAGPKRVKVFKDRAEQFFEPYNNVLDEVYEALLVAQSVGVDITDIYMMLSGSCNMWGQYLCAKGKDETESRHYYNKDSCPNNTVSVQGGWAKGGHDCRQNQIIPPEDDITCTMNKTLSGTEEVYRDWLDDTESSDGTVRVGCASSALDRTKLFAKRKKQASIDIEVLERIINQDAPSVYGTGLFGGKTTPATDGVAYCAINEKSLERLQKAVSLKQLPQKVCTTNDKIKSEYRTNSGAPADEGGASVPVDDMGCSSSLAANTPMCKCKNSGGTWTINNTCSCGFGMSEINGKCEFDMYGTTPQMGAVEKAANNVTKKLFDIPDLNANSKAIESCIKSGRDWDVKTHTCK